MLLQSPGAEKFKLAVIPIVPNPTNFSQGHSQLAQFTYVKVLLDGFDH
jgi:hypothetical protein